MVIVTSTGSVVVYEYSDGADTSKAEEKTTKYPDPAPGLLRKDVQNFLVQQINKNSGKGNVVCVRDFNW